MSHNKNRCLSALKLQMVYNDWLMQAYPALFNEYRLPMAMGIFEQLSEVLPAHISRTDLRKTLGWYASRIKYLQNLCRHEYRLNLDGSVASQITPEEKMAATKKLKAILRTKKLSVKASKPDKHG